MKRSMADAGLNPRLHEYKSDVLPTELAGRGIARPVPTWVGSHDVNLSPNANELRLFSDVYLGER